VNLSDGTRHLAAWAICALGAFVVISEFQYWESGSSLAPVLTALRVAAVLAGVLLVPATGASSDPRDLRSCKRASCGHSRDSHWLSGNNRLPCRDCTCPDFVGRP
jgi:hypothetical protein